ncbi:MAG: hypothetical protein WBM04_10310 [Candidatus Korobacteraceae bacterium]
MSENEQSAGSRRVYLYVAAALLIVGLVVLALARYLLGIVFLVGAAIFGFMARSPEWRATLSLSKRRSLSDEQPAKSAAGDPERDTRESKNLVLIATAVGVAALLLYAFSQPTAAAAAQRYWDAATVRTCLKLIGSLSLEAGTGFAFGALAGFLFGIPRSLQGKLPEQSRPGNGDAGSSNDSSNPESRGGERGRGGPGYGSNTNLEEISDWLTKIIVGLGLINLKLIPEKLRAVAWYFSVFTDVKLPEGISMSTLIYFSVCGFFFAYLLTRLALPAAFSRADRAADLEVTRKVARESAEEYLDPRWDVMRAKELLRSYKSSEGDQKQASKLLLERLIPDMKKNSQKQEFRTMRMLHIVLANTYNAFGNLKSATAVLERFLENLKKSSRGISGDAADAWYNLACYYSEQAAKTTDTTAKQEMLREAATYLKECLEVAEAVGDDLLTAEIAMAHSDSDLKALGESKEILREFGIADLWDGQKNG